MRYLIPILCALLASCGGRAQTPQVEVKRVFREMRYPRLEAMYTDRLRRCDSAAVKYVKTHANCAIWTEAKYGIPAHISLAVAMYESGFGKSNIARDANNHFGQKYYKAPQYMGELQPYKCGKGTLWQAYSTPRESYKAFANSAALAPFVYPHCEQLTPDKFAQTGWGGRKNKRRYAAALKSIISRYNLEKL